jgi:hypothetical protein
MDLDVGELVLRKEGHAERADTGGVVAREGRGSDAYPDYGGGGLGGRLISVRDAD